MIKKIISIAFVFALVGVMIVQAVEKEQNEQKKVEVQTVSTESSSLSDKELEDLYNNSMSSQVEEEPTDDHEDVPKGLDIGKKAPEFQLETLEGNSTKLSKYRGKKVIINFFATWCQPCKAEMPLLQKYYEQNQSNVEILGINIDTQSDVKGFVKKLGVDFPILLDKKDKVNTLYEIQPIPTSYLVDENGIIINKHIGSFSNKSFETFMNPSKH